MNNARENDDEMFDPVEGTDTSDSVQHHRDNELSELKKQLVIANQKIELLDSLVERLSKSTTIDSLEQRRRELDVRELSLNQREENFAKRSQWQFEREQSLDAREKELSERERRIGGESHRFFPGGHINNAMHQDAS
jgi:hypothetical protein